MSSYILAVILIMIGVSLFLLGLPTKSGAQRPWTQGPLLESIYPVTILGLVVMGIALVVFGGRS